MGLLADEIETKYGANVSELLGSPFVSLHFFQLFLQDTTFKPCKKMRAHPDVKHSMVSINCSRQHLLEGDEGSWMPKLGAFCPGYEVSQVENRVHFEEIWFGSNYIEQKASIMTSVLF